MKRIMLYLSIISMLLVLSGATPIEEPNQPELHGLDIASEWATDCITRAHELGLIPFRLFAFPTFTNYTLSITRSEFSALAVTLYETMTGEEIAGRMDFNDTTDINVQKLGYLGIVTGIGNGNFAPDSHLTREQAAVILMRLLSEIQDATPYFLPELDMLHLSDIFVDYALVSSWAVWPVSFIHGMGIMSGVGSDMFAPQEQYSREQAIVTMVRVFDEVNPWIFGDNLSEYGAISRMNGLDNITTLNYETFLELLKANNFEFESGNLYDRGVPTGRGSIYIGDERLIVARGFPFQADPLQSPLIEITWSPEYMWPSSDLLTIVYSGDDSEIITFLNKIFGERT